MGSRLRPSPESVLECFLEVAAPTDNEGPEIKFLHPTDFEDKEALKAVPQFCYPCVASTELAVQHYTFVLTDIEGKYRFGFCRYSPDVRSCLCILSYLPWFKIFYELLNRVSDFKRENEMKIILPLLNHLLNQVPPEPGAHLTVPVTGGIKEITLVIPDTSKLPSIPEDRNLTDYFAAVEPANMIYVFASMFFERRIIVTSKKLHLLTACTYGAASLLYPMHWQHMFVPIVPPHLLDYCCAPMPFLVGVHSSLMPKVRRMPLDEVVILDADTNQVESPFDDISQLPLDTVSNLKSALKRPVYPIDDNVSKAFLSAMVSLIGGYRDALRLKPGEKIVFDKDIFVQSKSNSTRQLLEFILQLQLFEQFISDRLEMLNAGRGFNDAFEDQIGMQAENKASWRSQYQLWLKETMKSGGALLDKTEEKMKKRYKEYKIGWKNVKTGIKSHLAEVKADIADKLKGKDEDELGEEPKRSNTCPDAKQFTVSRLSPFSKRRSISPSELAKLKLEGGSKVAPPRPPPPRPYSSDRRPRTSAFSIAGGKSPPELLSRRSAPDLTLETPVGDLISLDDNVTTVSKREINQPSADSKVRAKEDSSQGQEKHTSIEINQASTDVQTPSGTMDFAGPQFNLQQTGSEKQKVNATDTSLERCKSSSSRQKPPVPKRPPSVKRISQASVDAILETGKSAHVSSENLISPLRPVSLSLLQDTVASLGADTQEFLFTDPELNSLNYNSGGSSAITSKTDLQSAATQDIYPQIDITTHNNLQATALPLLEMRRGSGPYDNLQRNIPVQQFKFDTASADSRPEDVSRSQDSWVSFN